MNAQKMSRQVMLLRIAVYLVMFSQLGGMIGTFITDQNISLEISGDIWQQKISEFQLIDQLFLAALFACSSIVLLIALYQLILLCRIFDTGILFSQDTIKYCKRFSIFIIALACVNSLITPCLILFLWARNAIPAFPDLDFVNVLDNFDFGLLAFGILFFVISKIMETGFEMKNELELTI